MDVLLPIRLPAPWIDEALQSLRAQTIADWRLIAIIHGEPGDLPAIIQARSPDAVILSAPEAASLSDVLNLGLQAATAPFIARMDADDIAEPERLARELEAMDRHPRAGIVCSPITFIDEHGNSTGKRATAHTSVIRGLRWKNVIAHPTVMMRRTAVEQFGGYNATAWHAEDYELWLRLAARWEVVELPSPLLRYRIHSGQITRTKAIPAASRAAVARARVALAQARGESVLAALVRHMAWTLPQAYRQFRRAR